jgi:hypothetical protein
LEEIFPSVIGDAFNPIYAQGMSAAAKQAKILQDVLSEYAEQSRPLSGIASAFVPKAAEFNSTPWHLAAGFDLRSGRVINPAQWQWALINEVGRERRAGRIPLARDLPNACKPSSRGLPDLPIS